jgi:hypothetical protein
VNGYQFMLECPCCGSLDLEHVTGSTTAGTEAKAVARCLGCRAEWLVCVFLRRSLTYDGARAQKYRKVPA